MCAVSEFMITVMPVISIALLLIDHCVDNTEMCTSIGPYYRVGGCPVGVKEPAHPFIFYNYNNNNINSFHTHILPQNIRHMQLFVVEETNPMDMYCFVVGIRLPDNGGPSLAC